MAVTTTLPFAQAIQNDFASIVNATGAVGTTLTTAPSNAVLLSTTGANGAILKSLVVCSDDSSARVLVVYISPDAGTTKNPIATVSIPSNSGANGATVNVDILGSSVVAGLSIDQAGKTVLELAPNSRVYVGVQVAVTAAKFLNVFAASEQF